MSKCGKDRKEFPTVQEMERNTLLLGNVYVTMEPATYTGKDFQDNRNSIVSHLSKCLTYQQNWYQNKRRSQVWRRSVGRIIHENVCR